jgi:hypothetical protein
MIGWQIFHLTKHKIDVYFVCGMSNIEINGTIFIWVYLSILVLMYSYFRFGYGDVVLMFHHLRWKRIILIMKKL